MEEVGDANKAGAAVILFLATTAAGSNDLRPAADSASSKRVKASYEGLMGANADYMGVNEHSQDCAKAKSIT